MFSILLIANLGERHYANESNSEKFRVTFGIAKTFRTFVEPNWHVFPLDYEMLEFCRSGVVCNGT